MERRGEVKEQTLTIITAPVNVDAAPVVAGELGEGETCGVGCGQNGMFRQVASQKGPRHTTSNEITPELLYIVRIS